MLLVLLMLSGIPYEQSFDVHFIFFALAFIRQLSNNFVQVFFLFFNFITSDV